MSIFFGLLCLLARLLVLLGVLSLVVAEGDVCAGAASLGFAAVASSAIPVCAALSASVVVWSAGSIVAGAIIA